MPNEIALIRTLIKSVAHSRGRKLDDEYSDVLRFLGVDTLRAMSRDRIEHLVRHLHDIQIRAIMSG